METYTMRAAPDILISEAAQEFKRVDIEALLIGHSHTGMLRGPGHCNSSSKFFRGITGIPLILRVQRTLLTAVEYSYTCH